MVDLGEYAPYVLSAWAVTVAAMGGLTSVVILTHRQLRRQLADLERVAPDRGPDVSRTPTERRR